MARLHWLASYPKSGNTWVRILLAHYHAGAAVDLNRLDEHGSTGGFSRVLFDRYAPVKSSLLDPATADRIRPHVYRAMAADPTAPKLVKVHDQWRAPLFPADATAGAILVVRNILDLALSAAHHWGVDAEAAAARLGDEGFTLADGTGALSPSLPQQVGSWSGHAGSWLDASGLPVLVVRYEDLEREPATQLARILEFLEVDADPARISGAVERSAFAALQARERAEGFREHSPHARGRFFRRGESGAWRTELAPHLAQRLLAQHRSMMIRFGYIDCDGHLTDIMVKN